MDTDTLPVDTDSPDAKQQQPTKRPAPESLDDAPRRRPRGRYTPVACDGCKKRKLKCLPVENKASCQRCLARGLACRYTETHQIAQTSKNKGESSRQYVALQTEVSQLRQELADLSQTVKTLSSHIVSSPSSSRNTADTARPAPKQPQFVGPTRSAFGFLIGNSSLTRMGIPTEDALPLSQSHSPPPDPPEGHPSEADYWSRCTEREVVRLLYVYKDEIASLYPFFDIDDLAPQAENLLLFIQHEECPDSRAVQEANRPKPVIDPRDVEIARLAMGISLVLEACGKSEIGAMIVQPIADSAYRLSGPEVDLKQIQLLTLLSVYYLQSDDDLLAWRAIGVAARATLEMGLHRKTSLLDNFTDVQSRQLAIRIFWCVYLLDRRYSFGTGLSFALSDNDIDPDLPKPNAEFSYLNCMIGYGLLSSKIWGAIPPFESPSHLIPADVVESLEQSTREWIETIPPHFQLRHPRQRRMPAPQPSVLHRLRALLYLRGNNTRILIYRHHLFSTASLTANLDNARLVVDIAQDSIEVLVHLNETTDIYSRQLTAFNYFLVGALAVLFLAVCHAPKIFSDQCRKSFMDALELVRGFSRQNSVSRRLWEYIRGLPTRLKRLVLQGAEDAPLQGSPVVDNNNVTTDSMSHPDEAIDRNGKAINFHARDNEADHINLHNGNTLYTREAGASMPDMLQMGDNLMDLFDLFGQWEQPPGGFDNTHTFGTEDPGSVNMEGGNSLLFPGFI